MTPHSGMSKENAQKMVKYILTLKKNKMEILEEQIIGELVAENYKTASVFKNLKLTFCCNGNRTISEACQRKT